MPPCPLVSSLPSALRSHNSAVSVAYELLCESIQSISEPNMEHDGQHAGVVKGHPLKKELLTARSCKDLDGLHPNSGETPIRHEGTHCGRCDMTSPFWFKWCQLSLTQQCNM